MSTTLAFRWSLQSVIDGEAQPSSPRGEAVPQKVISCSGTINHHGRLVIPKRNPTDPQPDPTLLWEWLDGQDFPEIVVVEIVGTSGSLRIHSKYDAATDGTTPTTRLRERTSGPTPSISCWFPIPMVTTGQINATLATAAGLDGDDFPAIATDTGSGSGYMYAVGDQPVHHRRHRRQRLDQG